MAKVELVSIRKAFQGSAAVIPDFSMEVQSGEFIALVGPSGCGKSTLLRMIAGLEEPTSGTIRLDGRVVNGVSPKDRGLAMVFQNYALYPHMSVRENLGFALKMARMNRSEIEGRIDETAAMLGLEPYLERKPSQLSGGQKQRVAMGRAMIRRPRVLLFDEPLSNLDAQLRVRVRAEIAQLHKKLKSTVIYVTHDQVEAMTLADRIAVLNQGRLEQFGAPLEVYRKPRTRFVASFIGTPPMNLMGRSALGGLSLRSDAHTIGFRPEAVRLHARGGQDQSGIQLGSGVVTLVEPLGSTTYVHSRIGHESVVAELRSSSVPHVGDEISVSVDSRDVFHFDAQGDALAGERS